jgi:hypothetical protein
VELLGGAPREGVAEVVAQGQLTPEGCPAASDVAGDSAVWRWAPLGWWVLHWDGGCALMLGEGEIEASGPPDGYSAEGIASAVQSAAWSHGPHGEQPEGVRKGWTRANGKVTDLLECLAMACDACDAHASDFANHEISIRECQHEQFKALHCSLSRVGDGWGEKATALRAMAAKLVGAPHG